MEPDIGLGHGHMGCVVEHLGNEVGVGVFTGLFSKRNKIYNFKGNHFERQCYMFPIFCIYQLSYGSQGSKLMGTKCSRTHISRYLESRVDTSCIGSMINSKDNEH